MTASKHHREIVKATDALLAVKKCYSKLLWLPFNIGSNDAFDDFLKETIA